MTKYRQIALCACAVLVTSCASPQTARPGIDATTIANEQQRQSEFVLESRAADYRRVYEIAQRLSYANAELCARQGRTIGIRVENLTDYGRDFREAARTLWSMDNTPAVIWVGTESPAGLAGVQVHDRLIAVNGRAIPTSGRASRQAINLIRDASDAGDVTLQLRRGAQTLVTTMSPREACAYEFHMLDDETANAAADGRSIYVNRGLLRFVRSDDELALVLGHELAHNAMRHIEARQQNRAAAMAGGLLLDVLAAAAGVNTGGAFTDAAGDVGATMFQREFESEADYVGMYFIARAGYGIDGVEHFWRRMSAEYPRGIRVAYTHPNFAERFVGLAAARQEITTKVERSIALRPNMRGDRAAPLPASELPEATGEIAPSPAEPAAAPPQPSAEPIAVAPQ